MAVVSFCSLVSQKSIIVYFGVCRE